MGAIQNAINQTIGTAAVGAHALKSSIGKISESNDGKKAQAMGKKARSNVKDAIEAKREVKKITSASFDQNNPAARATVREIMGGR